MLGCSFEGSRMNPDIGQHALMNEPPRCPQCESHLRLDGSCACGYGKEAPKPKPVGSVDLAAVERNYMARVRARMNEKALASSWWADKILERHARGEHIDILALEWARECATNR